MSPPITIVGMGMSPDDLTDRQRTAIEAADILAGSDRLLDGFAHLPCRKRVINRDLKGLGDFLHAQMAAHAIVVLTSGDPLFYGIGAFLVRRLGAANVRILPNVSAVAVAFARLGEPWHDVRVISLHGRRRTGELLRRLAAGDTVAVYTDPTRHPGWLAGLLEDNGFADTTMTVLEQLGAPDERIRSVAPEEARHQDFADLNLVVLKPHPDRRTAPALFAGMPDDHFVHTNGMITKAEVRAVCLSRLRLFDRAVLWDLGAGCGSVAIEAGLFVTRGEICAVEQNAERVRQIQRNRSRFGIGNLEILHRRMPAGLDELPDPDRVFVGGGGRDLGAIVRLAAGRLKPAGVMVINTVLIDNLTAARDALAESGLALDMVQIQVSRAKPMPFSHRLEAANPVWIVTGSRS